MEGQTYQHKVQYYETDQMGIVHHSNYIRWFEEARTNFMEEMGCGYHVLEQEGVISPVLAVEAKYLRMVRFGDTVTITTSVKQYNGIKLTVGYQVVDNKTGMTMCTGETKHCFLDATGRPISLKKEKQDYHQMFQDGLETYMNSNSHS